MNTNHMSATIGTGYYSCSTEAFNRVIHSHGPSLITIELRKEIEERSQTDASGYNLAECLMILADFEQGAMDNEREGEAKSKATYPGYVHKDDFPTEADREYDRFDR
jgi:hypothetical protein